VLVPAIQIRLGGLERLEPQALERGPLRVADPGHETQHEHWSQSVGYALIEHRWCIRIETRKGAEWQEENDVERWPFAKALGIFQPKAVDKLLELIESLVAPRMPQ
jgi:hypothetical protein